MGSKNTCKGLSPVLYDAPFKNLNPEDVLANETSQLTIPKRDKD
jgi:hypothetical protein